MVIPLEPGNKCSMVWQVGLSESPCMKCVFTSPDSAELGLLKNLLEKAGIRCAVRNEQMAQVIPSAPFQAELWVEGEADYLAALALLAEWQRPAHTDGAVWTCSRCGETLESQFNKCWKCGTRRDAAQGSTGD